jgi:hypothetical protein
MASCAIANTDEWSTNVDERTTEEILRKVENLSAGKLQKKDLEVLEVLVGLRPARYVNHRRSHRFDLSQQFTGLVWNAFGGRRTEVRLEKEEFSHGAAKKTVIHNYGHGGTAPPRARTITIPLPHSPHELHGKEADSPSRGGAPRKWSRSCRARCPTRPGGRTTRTPRATSKNAAQLGIFVDLQKGNCLFSFSHGARRWQHGGRGKQEEVVTPA